MAYQSLIDVNINNEPDLSPALWAVGTTYAAAAQVTGSDGIVYQSIGSGNVGNNPISDGGAHWTNTGVLSPWTTSFVGGSGSVNWLQIGGAEFPMGVALTRTLNIVYPIGALARPSPHELRRKNVFHLPESYLRIAPQKIRRPDGGSCAWLGSAPPGITSTTGCSRAATSSPSQSLEGPDRAASLWPISPTSRQMHAMFCEGLAARASAYEVWSERVTQSTAKVGTIGKVYESWIAKAKVVDAIEIGQDELHRTSPDDLTLPIVSAGLAHG